MDKTHKERILHALQRLEQNVGRVCKYCDGVIAFVAGIIEGGQREKRGRFAGVPLPSCLFPLHPLP